MRVESGSGAGQSCFEKLFKENEKHREPFIYLRWDQPMTNAKLQSRISELEAEVTALKAQLENLTPSTKKWLRHVEEKPIFQTDREANKFRLILRQLKDADRELAPSPTLSRLRRNYKALLKQLKSLGHFKSQTAAAEYAHREFTR
jgi:hypothetical protein